MFGSIIEAISLSVLVLLLLINDSPHVNNILQLSLALETHINTIYKQMLPILAVCQSSSRNNKGYQTNGMETYRLSFAIEKLCAQRA